MTHKQAQMKEKWLEEAKERTQKAPSILSSCWPRRQIVSFFLPATNMKKDRVRNAFLNVIF